MAHALIKTFDVGAGDCIFFVLNNGDRQFSIMIDCGRYDDSIGNYVSNELGNHIDLLIVTHIDEDHVVGINDMLSELKDLNIDRIIFNCAQLTKVKPKDLPPSAKEAIEKIKNSKAKKGGMKKEVSAPSGVASIQPNTRVRRTEGRMGQAGGICHSSFHPFGFG